MGAVNFFSSDSRDDKCVKFFSSNIRDDKTTNPDPSNFVIIKSERINDYLLILINYPDCTNYEGNKILVYDKLFAFSNITKIDPHFFDQNDSPIARFEPTDRGWKMAISFVENYKE
jgi:hypothetical protein